jgi:hypothetical protein
MTINDTLHVAGMDFVFRVVRPSEFFIGRLTGALCVNVPYVTRVDDNHPCWVYQRGKIPPMSFHEPIMPGGYNIP